MSLHWFSDNVSVAKKAAEQGCCFSVNHRLMRGDSGTALVRSVPSERLLTETAAPFTEVNGRRSEPRDAMTMAEALARTRGVSVAQISEALRANAARVFAFAGLDSSFTAELG